MAWHHVTNTLSFYYWIWIQYATHTSRIYENPLPRVSFIRTETRLLFLSHSCLPNINVCEWNSIHHIHEIAFVEPRRVIIIGRRLGGVLLARFLHRAVAKSAFVRFGRSVGAFDFRAAKYAYASVCVCLHYWCKTSTMVDHNQKLLQELLKKPGNNVCADCGSPGMFLCYKSVLNYASVFLVRGIFMGWQIGGGRKMRPCFGVQWPRRKVHWMKTNKSTSSTTWDDHNMQISSRTRSHQMTNNYIYHKVSYCISRYITVLR